MNLKHCIGQKFNVNVIKAAHRRSNFLKTLVSQEILANIDLRKKSVLNYIFLYNFANVVMKPEPKV